MRLTTACSYLVKTLTTANVVLVRVGFTAIAASGSSPGSIEVGSTISLYSSVGPGVGGLFVSIALVAALAYFDLLQGAEADVGIQRYVLSAIIPLLLTFTTIVLFESARITDLI